MSLKNEMKYSVLISNRIVSIMSFCMSVGLSAFGKNYFSFCSFLLENDDTYSQKKNEVHFQC